MKKVCGKIVEFWREENIPSQFLVLNVRYRLQSRLRLTAEGILLEKSSASSLVLTLLSLSFDDECNIVAASL